jgi:hypothetical protein
MTRGGCLALWDNIGRWVSVTHACPLYGSVVVYLFSVKLLKNLVLAINLKIKKKGMRRQRAGENKKAEQGKGERRKVTGMEEGKETRRERAS